MAQSTYDSHNVYVNVPIRNPTTSKETIRAVFEQQLLQPLLDKADDWKCSIERFAVPVSSLPYFNNANSVYKIALSWRGVQYQETITVPAYSALNPTNTYYINQFLDALNSALQTQYVLVQAANTTDYQLLNNHQPYFEYDAKSQLISVVTDKGVWTSGIATLFPAIYLNTPLANLLQGLPQQEITLNSVGGLDSQLVIVDRPIQLGSQPLIPFSSSTQTYTKGETETTISMTALPFGLPIGAQLTVGSSTSPIPQVVTLSAAAAAGATSVTVTSFVTAFAYATGDIISYQPPALNTTEDEVSSAVGWFNAYSIVVQSRQMPFRKLNVPANGLTGGQAQNTSLAAQAVVADVLYPGGERVTADNSIQYIPVERRWIDMISDGNVSFLDASLWWSDQSGNLSPILLAPGQSGSILFLFRRRFEHVAVVDQKAEAGLAAFGGAGGAARLCGKRKGDFVTPRRL